MKLKNSTLKEQPELVNETIKLVESSFLYTQNFHYDKDFYPLMRKENHHNCHVLMDGDTLVGHLGVLPQKLVYKDIEVDVLFIGGIAIAEKHRGKGYFTPFFNDIIKKYSNDYAMMFLWSEKSNLYKKHGFYECGSVYQTGEEIFNGHVLISGFHQANKETLTDENFKQILNLYNKGHRNLIVPKRSLECLKEYILNSSVDLFIQPSDNDEIKNYFFINKGFDLNDIIHEISFHEDSKIIEEFAPYKLWLANPYPDEHINFYLGLAKIANQDKFKDFIEKTSDSSIEIQAIDENVEFLYNNQIYSLKHKDFLTGVFGPGKIKEFNQLMPAFYIPGIESI
jgi:predicted GNAT family N-acyltransferase